MSLKAFHIFFIVVSTVFCVGFGLWGGRRFAEARDPAHLAIAVGATLGAIALAVYARWFIRKVRRLGAA